MKKGDLIVNSASSQSHGVRSTANLLVLLLCLIIAGLPGVSRADMLDKVFERETIVCGVGADLQGFSSANSLGEYSGLDVDLCRAAASALFDNPEAVSYVPVNPDDQYQMLLNGEIDILSRKAAWTLANNTSGGQFVGINYYDGQGFMVNREQGLRSALELDSKPLCVVRNPKSEMNIIDFFTTNRMRYVPIYFEEEDKAYAALETGQCTAMTADRSTLAAQRTRLKQPDAFNLLPEIISKKPLGPMVRTGESRWENVVRWTLNCMISAEELGVNSASVTQGGVNSTLAERRLQGLEGNDGSLLGLNLDWCARIIRHVGNYGESYERNIGSQTPIALPRGVNRLWTDGGLLYSLPIH